VRLELKCTLVCLLVSLTSSCGDIQKIGSTDCTSYPIIEHYDELQFVAIGLINTYSPYKNEQSRWISGSVDPLISYAQQKGDRRLVKQVFFHARDCIQGQLTRLAEKYIDYCSENVAAPKAAYNIYLATDDVEGLYCSEKIKICSRHNLAAVADIQSEYLYALYREVYSRCFNSACEGKKAFGWFAQQTWVIELAGNFEIKIKDTVSGRMDIKEVSIFRESDHILRVQYIENGAGDCAGMKHYSVMEEYMRGGI